MKQEIFIAVVGTTPQIVTETLYYYSHPFYGVNRRFDEIKLITTQKGKDLLMKLLFEERQLEALSKALGLSDDNIALAEKDIILLRKDGEAILDDVRETDDYDSMSALFDVVKQYTDDPKTRVTATVAGGRKTMSAMMALALQLYGREHDELIHILAPDDKMVFGSKWYFPDDPADPEQKLEVSHFPILRIGRYLGAELKLPPSVLLNKLQEKIIDQAPITELRIQGNVFISGEEKLKIRPQQAAFLRSIIQRRLKADCPEDCQGCEKCAADRNRLGDELERYYLPEYGKVKGFSNPTYVTQKEKISAAKYPGEVINIDEQLSRLREAIEGAVISKKFKDALRLQHLHLDPTSQKLTWYGVVVNKEIVKFEE
jgi:CRISPR-associated protein (TIGR02584 family)